jgi:hypothetical protein
MSSIIYYPIISPLMLQSVQIPSHSRMVLPLCRAGVRAPSLLPPPTSTWLAAPATVAMSFHLLLLVVLVVLLLLVLLAVGCPLSAAAPA